MNVATFLPKPQPGKHRKEGHKCFYIELLDLLWETDAQLQKGAHPHDCSCRAFSTFCNASRTSVLSMIA
jgi:hypothetical protein